jgi:hypothetical protein
VSQGYTALDCLPGGDSSRNPVFTRVFLAAIDAPGLDFSGLGTWVRDEVCRLARSADHQQTPAVYDRDKPFSEAATETVLFVDLSLSKNSYARSRQSSTSPAKAPGRA